MIIICIIISLMMACNNEKGISQNQEEDYLVKVDKLGIWEGEIGPYLTTFLIDKDNELHGIIHGSTIGSLYGNVGSFNRFKNNLNIYTHEKGELGSDYNPYGKSPKDIEYELDFIEKQTITGKNINYNLDVSIVYISNKPNEDINGTWFMRHIYKSGTNMYGDTFLTAFEIELIIDGNIVTGSRTDGKGWNWSPPSTTISDINGNIIDNGHGFYDVSLDISGASGIYDGYAFIKTGQLFVSIKRKKDGSPMIMRLIKKS